MKEPIFENSFEVTINLMRVNLSSPDYEAWRSSRDEYLKSKDMKSFWIKKSLESVARKNSIFKSLLSFLIDGKNLSDATELRMMMRSQMEKAVDEIAKELGR